MQTPPIYPILYIYTIPPTLPPIVYIGSGPQLVQLMYMMAFMTHDWVVVRYRLGMPQWALGIRPRAPFLAAADPGI